MMMMLMGKGLVALEVRVNKRVVLELLDEEVESFKEMIDYVTKDPATKGWRPATKHMAYNLKQALYDVNKV